ncbi:MAG: molybdate ABC transporter permease subunit [Gammaproteobacteria bacterium]|nr:molybdate ABC transporter permease subunit [Gammaproteobacteria bacterium]
MSDLLQSLLLTGALAGTTTIFLLIIALPLSWWLARTRHRSSSFVEALVALPLVLPPTVLGFYLLLAMAEEGWLGQVWGFVTGAPLAFTFAGLVIASIIYSLPFVSQPLTTSFRNTPTALLDAASLMGVSPTKRFVRLVIPMHGRALVAAAVLGFAHTVGEFGIVLMIGGNIPGETRVLSILLFDQVEALDYASAHITAGVLLTVALVTLTATYSTLRQPQ